MKKEYILLAIVTIALGAYLYFQDSDYTQYTLPQPAALKDTDITKIEISKKDATLILNKESKNWTIDEEKYPADTAKVIALLDAIKEIKLTALISESGNYPRYDLDDGNKIAVTAYNQDKILRRFDVGKTASSYKHTFIKLDANKKVYQAAKNLKSTFDISFDKVVDKTVMKLNAGAAYAISTFFDGKKYEFGKKMEEIKVDLNKDKEKKDETVEKPAAPQEAWFSAKGDKKDKSVVDAFLKKFSDVKCDSYAKDKKKEDLKEPVFTVTLKTDKEYTLSAFKSETEETFICTSSENAFPFMLSSDTIKDFQEAFKKI